MLLYYILCSALLQRVSLSLASCAMHMQAVMRGKNKTSDHRPLPPSLHHRANTPHRANTYPHHSDFFSCSFSLACEIGQEVAFLYPAGRKSACVLGPLLVQNRQRPSIPAGHPSSKCKKRFFLSLHDFGEVADHVRELCRLWYRLSR